METSFLAPACFCSGFPIEKKPTMYSTFNSNKLITHIEDHKFLQDENVKHISDFKF